MAFPRISCFWILLDTTERLSKVSLQWTTYYLIWNYRRRSFGVILTILHINPETNAPPPIINVVCKYLRQFIGTSFGVVAIQVVLSQYTATLTREGPDLFLQSEPLQKIDLVLIIYVRYCHKTWRSWLNKIGNCLVFQ